MTENPLKLKRPLDDCIHPHAPQWWRDMLAKLFPDETEVSFEDIERNLRSLIIAHELTEQHLRESARCGTIVYLGGGRFVGREYYNPKIHGPKRKYKQDTASREEIIHAITALRELRNWSAPFRQ
jgi:hypothetical protein